MEIKPYQKNPKKHPESQLRKIAASLKEFGWRQPIVVDRNDEIIVGHGRWFAYQKYPDGIGDPWIVRADDLTDEQVKAYRLADNKLNESDWDMGLAIEELKELSDEMFELTGFDKDLLFDIDEDNFDAQAEYDKISEPLSKLGDLWALGEHRLLCGDSTQMASYGTLFESRGKVADMVFTDPPYNVNYGYNVFYTDGRKKPLNYHAFDDNKKDNDFKKFILDVFKNCFDFSRLGANFYCWHATKTESLFRSGIEEAGWHIAQTIYWLKNQPTLGFLDYMWITEPCYFGWKQGEKHYIDRKLKMSMKNVLLLDVNEFSDLLDVAYSKRDKIKNYIHPTQKPIRLAERALKKHSDEGFIILEPFNGSGSTMMACEYLKRKCYAIELDPKYVDVSILRWENSTGKKAIKL